MLNCCHHLITYVLAGDAARGGKEAHGLPITAIECKDNPHSVAVVAADLEAVGAPARRPGSSTAMPVLSQGELVNPEKSLVATIRRHGPNGTEQTFRYAPLSSGLDSCAKFWASNSADDVHRPGGRDYQSQHNSDARVARMDRLRLAGLCHQRDCDTAPDARRYADLWPALRPVHEGGHCRRRRRRSELPTPTARPSDRQKSEEGSGRLNGSESKLSQFSL